MSHSFEDARSAYAFEIPGIGRIRSAQMIEGAFIINGQTYPIVEWNYPIPGVPSKISEPMIVIEHPETGQHLRLPASHFETLFGARIPQPDTA